MIAQDYCDLMGGQISNPKVSDERSGHCLSSETLLPVVGKMVWSPHPCKIGHFLKYSKSLK